MFLFNGVDVAAASRHLCARRLHGQSDQNAQLSSGLSQRVHELAQLSYVQSGRVELRLAPLHRHYGRDTPQMHLPRAATRKRVRGAERPEKVAPRHRAHTGQAAQPQRAQQAHMSSAVARQPRTHRALAQRTVLVVSHRAHHGHDYTHAVSRTRRIRVRLRHQRELCAAAAQRRRQEESRAGAGGSE